LDKPIAYYIPDMGFCQKARVSENMEQIYLATKRGFKILDTDERDLWSRENPVGLRQVAKIDWSTDSVITFILTTKDGKFVFLGDFYYGLRIMGVD
jgi:hypothetical protein